jgi:hypothetical protein
VMAELAARWKRCGSRTGCSFEGCKGVMAELAGRWKWFGSKKSSLFKVCKGVAAELAACWKRCKGAMAEPASGLSEETLKMALPYLAWAWRQLFLERLAATLPILADSTR